MFIFLISVLSLELVAKNTTIGVWDRAYTISYKEYNDAMEKYIAKNYPDELNDVRKERLRKELLFKKAIKAYKSHRQSVNTVINYNEKYIVSVTYKTIELRNRNTGEFIRSFEGHTGWVNSVITTPNGKYIISGSEDNTIKLWNINTGKLIKSFEGHTNEVWSVTTTPDGKYIISGSEDNTIKLWNINTGKLIKSLEKKYRHSIWSVTTTPNGKYIISGSSDEVIKLWNINTGKLIKSLEVHRIYAGAKTTPNGKYIISGSSDEIIKLWNINTGKLIRDFEGYAKFDFSITTTPNGKYIVSGSLNDLTKLWQGNL